MNCWSDNGKKYAAFDSKLENIWLCCDFGITLKKDKSSSMLEIVTEIIPEITKQSDTSGSGSSSGSDVIVITSTAEPITIAKAPASVKVKAGKKGRVTVSWKKIKKTKKTKALLGQIKSIQVQYSTDPNFAANVVTKSVSKKKTKATLSLQRKTQYYIRVRYVGSDGFSNWGTVKAVKTK